MKPSHGQMAPRQKALALWQHFAVAASKVCLFSSNIPVINPSILYSDAFLLSIITSRLYLIDTAIVSSGNPIISPRFFDKTRVKYLSVDLCCEGINFIYYLCQCKQCIQQKYISTFSFINDTWACSHNH